MSEKVYSIEEIKQILKEILDTMPVYSVTLFGSYANSTATKVSDIDLVIDTRETLIGFKLYSLITQIEEKSVKYVVGYSYEEFIKDNKTVDATVFNISQIGELVKNVSNETKNKYTNIEWNMIKGLRNRIIHDYEGINLKSIWYILKNDILELKAELKKILADEKNI